MKNSIFNLKRFGTYLLNDLRIAKNKYGLSLLILGLMPAILFIIFTLCFSWADQNEVFRNFYGFGAAYLGTFVSILLFPSKAYSRVANRKLGAGFILLPASTFEKCLSMFVVSLVAMPLVFLCIFSLCDGLLSLCFNATYGDFFYVNAVKLIKDYFDIDNIFLSSFVITGILSLVEAVMIFLLGTVVFRTQAVGKTILACFCIGIITSILGISIFGGAVNNGFLDGWLDAMNSASSDDIIEVGKTVLRTTILGSVACICALGAGVYYRVKTIQF